MKKFIIFTLCIVFSSVQAETTEYTINSGDILEVSVWKEEALQRELRVLPDGSISFPLIGVVKVLGKSISTVQREIANKLSEYITEPIVNVFVKEAIGNAVYVTGKVKAPGKFIMHQPMDIMQILSLAGGLTVFANKNDILIFRRSENDYEAIEFEYGEMEDGDDLNKNIFLKSGDVIVVP